MKSILVVGSVALDTIETPSGSVQDAPGGSAIYFSAAASFFAGVNLVGVAGDDFPRERLEFLQERGVDLAGLEVVPGGRSFRYHGRYHVDPNHRESLLTELNVFQDFNPILPQPYRNTELLFLANIDPDLQLQVLDQTEAPELVILDTMNFWIERKLARLRQVIARTDVLIVNDSEVQQLSGQPNVVLGARMLREAGPRVVIVKKGEHGALMLTESGFFVVPAYPLEQVCDPTGAGDTFAGGFTGWLAGAERIEEQSLRRALVYASTLASFSVEDFSVQRLERLTLPEIEQRVAQFRQMTSYD
ncbi:sugar kinase [bacterium]|nr:sugar kinase [bacterium]